MKNYNLAQIQSSFLQAISSESDEPLTRIIKHTKPVSAKTRIAIYRDAYHIRLIESLKDDFNEVQKEIGHSEFEILATQYIKECPSQFYNLAEFSADFPQFIQKVKPDFYEKTMLEWLKILSAHAPDVINEEIISLFELDQSVPFVFIYNPALYHFRTSTGISITYKHNDTVSTQALTENEFKILSLFESEISLDQLINKIEIENSDLSFELIQNLLTQFIQKHIIICKRKKYV